MIELVNLTKAFRTPRGLKYVANDISMRFPTGRSVALLGANGTGKSTLLKMIAGTADPDSGKVRSDGSISWPVGFSGSFHRDLTGAQNIRFIARLYGVDTQALLDFVEAFADLGGHFHMPLRSYSSGMKSRLAFGVSMGIPFDTYLVDEVTSVGDAAFRRRSEKLFRRRMRKASAIVVSHSPKQIRALCNAGAVLVDGRLIYFDKVKAALRFHKSHMQSMT
ncbi:MAG: ABC transporter ATP-binding protein [Paracoccaceae bacterium]